MSSAGIIPLGARLDGGRLVLDRPDGEAASLIEEGRLLLLPGCPEEDALAWRRDVHAWSRQRPPHPRGESASVPGVSFHRLDDESFPSHLPHVFHQFALCDGTHGDPALWRESLRLLGPLLALQNRLAGTDLSFSDPQVRVKITNHPVGGGYLVRHAHPLKPMRVAVFLSLSRPGADYGEGDVVFHVDGAPVALREHFAPGQAVFFRYDLPHEVTPVDPGAPRDWSDRAGLWLASVELVESHRRTSRR